MTPEERQLLNGLADRIRNAPAQQKDEEAVALIRDLVQARPDTSYILAQTTLMQDFALRSAQAQIADLQRQLADAKQTAPASGGSFLGGLFGGSPSVPAAGSVPPANPWARPAQPYAQPAYTQPVYAAPVLQPSQTSGFLQSAAQTAVGVAGGMLLFEGMESLFSGHHGGWGGYGGGPWGGGGFGGGYGPTENITEVVNNNYYDAPGGGQQQTDFTQDPANLQDDGFTDASFDDGGSDFGGNDDQSI
ncbi:MAG TPA: DUF2076 domain-containing protein [Aliidongia sp.]|uniref:DUF2076 domain-containing protein n=1 Tax=Aliidongia sp. TaxID=1914230 RepID=UPI002DDD1CCE|nr:DUF2076 domain-containing protein [Aliidongia sp.]HEV2675174.1 DUF2076 domain-containing protein [Aliidongia sp.]